MSVQWDNSSGQPTNLREIVIERSDIIWIEDIISNNPKMQQTFWPFELLKTFFVLHFCSNISLAFYMNEPSKM